MSFRCFNDVLPSYIYIRESRRKEEGQQGRVLTFSCLGRRKGTIEHTQLTGVARASSDALIGMDPFYLHTGPFAARLVRS
jgi:hypothetical protein